MKITDKILEKIEEVSNVSDVSIERDAIKHWAWIRFKYSGVWGSTIKNAIDEVVGKESFYETIWIGGKIHKILNVSLTYKEVSEGK